MAWRASNRRADSSTPTEHWTIGGYRPLAKPAHNHNGRDDASLDGRDRPALEGRRRPPSDDRPVRASDRALIGVRAEAQRPSKRSRTCWSMSSSLDSDRDRRARRRRVGMPDRPDVREILSCKRRRSPSCPTRQVASGPHRPHRADSRANACSRGGTDGSAMLVVGVHGHRTMGRALVGSVSRGCLQHARCPVVVIGATACAHLRSPKHPSPAKPPDSERSRAAPSRTRRADIGARLDAPDRRSPRGITSTTGPSALSVPARVAHHSSHVAGRIAPRPG